MPVVVPKTSARDKRSQKEKESRRARSQSYSPAGAARAAPREPSASSSGTTSDESDACTDDRCEFDDSRDPRCRPYRYPAHYPVPDKPYCYPAHYPVPDPPRRRAGVPLGEYIHSSSSSGHHHGHHHHGHHHGHGHYHHGFYHGPQHATEFQNFPPFPPFPPAPHTAPSFDYFVYMAAYHKACAAFFSHLADRHLPPTAFPMPRGASSSSSSSDSDAPPAPHAHVPPPRAPHAPMQPPPHPAHPCAHWPQPFQGHAYGAGYGQGHGAYGYPIHPWDAAASIAHAHTQCKHGQAGGCAHAPVSSDVQMSIVTVPEPSIVEVAEVRPTEAPATPAKSGQANLITSEQASPEERPVQGDAEGAQRLSAPSSLIDILE